MGRSGKWPFLESAQEINNHESKKKTKKRVKDLNAPMNVELDIRRMELRVSD